MMLACVMPTNLTESEKVSSLLQDWHQDTITFLRHDVPKIVFILIASFILVRLLRGVTRQVAAFQTQRLSGMRAQQIRTLASVINSMGSAVILFVATLMALSQLGLNLGPLLASAGIAGLAIGFGAQALVRDVINGFFILLENQFDIGDTVRLAGVKGTVEGMSLRRSILRDDDGTLHMVPNGQITVVSNMTRDWAQLAMRISVSYNESSDRVVQLLQQIAEEVRHDPRFEDDIVADIEVPGIDRVGNGEVEYLLLVKTRPGKQWAVSRELRRLIKDCFQKNNIQPGAPGRLYVVDQGTDAKT